MLRPKGGLVPTIKIRSGEYFSTMSIALPMFPGVLPSTPVPLTCHGVLDVHASPKAVSATIYFITGIRSIYGVNIIATTLWLIPRFVGGVKTGMVR